MKHSFEVDGIDYELWLSPCPQGYLLRLGDEVVGPVAFSDCGSGSGLLSIANERRQVRFFIDGDTIHLHIGGRTRILRYRDPLRALACANDEPGHLMALAPMPGVVIATRVSPGQSVSAGTELIIIESMKLQTVIRSPKDAQVALIHFKEGESFERDAVLVTLSEEVR
ncbi:biotin/lipoyl-containing protein [Bradyrhizobium sp. ARR65]|uniref:acetyl-CoA carboxylase biotin carboxyl carrier protein subunit n=1 Tax=Bradyrhizobium sp. ARR65 TaxID=1040989 RepID=UPI0004658DEE|nr:biotin/lipoyl-containing protein [Bradyrhizobium sp. ARR65]